MQSVKNYIFLLLGILLMATPNAWAQRNDSLIKDNQIEVIKNFKPVLSEAIKIPVNPNPEKPEYVKPLFSYSLPNAQYHVQPTIYTIKPLSLGTMLLPKLRGNYIKIGYGNFNMPLFEGYLNTTRNKNYQAGLFVKHLSGNGDENYNNFSNNTAYGYVKKFTAKGVLGADAYYHRNRVNLYGAPNDALTLSKDPKFIYQLVDIKTNYQNYSKDSAGLLYKVDLNYYNFNNFEGFKENDFALKGRISKQNTDLPFELVTGLRFNNNMIKNTVGDYYNYQRIYFDLNPQLFMNSENFYLKAGFNSTINSDSTNSTFHFYPKAEGAYHIIKNKLTVYGGLTGWLDPITYRSVWTENPFVNQMTLRNTSHNLEAYFGFKGELGQQTSFLISFNAAKIENLTFYSTDSATAEQILVYDTGKSKLSTISIGLQHQWNEKFRMGIIANILNYKLTNVAQPYTRPQFETKLNSTYNISDKFLVKLDVIYWGLRYGRLDAKRTDGSIMSTDDKMDPFVDLNFGVDYRYNKKLSAFIQFNNIANNPYSRYYKYPVYGINIMGGLTFTF